MTLTTLQNHPVDFSLTLRQSCVMPLTFSLVPRLSLNSNEAAILRGIYSVFVNGLFNALEEIALCRGVRKFLQREQSACQPLIASFSLSLSLLGISTTLFTELARPFKGDQETNPQ